jgi:hypothetical protein
MKYIFTIHSPLTFLVAYATIEKLKLDRNDVILFVSKYKIPVGGFNVVKSFQDQYKTSWQKLWAFNVPNKFDQYINQVTGGSSFVAYVDLMSYYQKILITHTHCKAFHFIEEGNSAYMRHDDLADLTWPERQMSYRVSGWGSKSFIKSVIRVLRGYNLRLLSIPYHYMAYANFTGIQFYCFSANAFFNAPPHKKVLVSLTKDNPDVLVLSKHVQLNNELIWIDGSNGRYTGIAEEYYYQAIDKAILLVKRADPGRKKVYVKLRPGIKNVDTNYLVAKLKQSAFHVEVLPGDLLLEALFITSANCTVIGNLTAALEYAHVFGHQAYSIYNLFEKRVPTFFDRMEGFWKNVKYLN